MRAVDPDFFQPSGHAASLTAEANRAVAAEDYHSAFCFADRACRVSADPQARDFLMRSLLHQALGRERSASADRARAMTMDRSDRWVARIILSRDADPDLRMAAARTLVADERTSTEDLVKAIAALLDAGPQPVIKAGRQGRRVSGWVLWRGPRVPLLAVRSESAQVQASLRCDRNGPCPAEVAHSASFDFAADPLQPIELAATLPEGGTTVVTLYALAAPVRQFAAPPLHDGQPPGLNVIVPVYKDRAATAACLSALFDQHLPTAVHYWLVDDCTPDRTIAALLGDYALRPATTVIRNHVNHGFAGSVNRALARCPAGDVLLLNSDVVLPPDALARLRLAAHAAADIGTAMPLSNDSEFTSFPVAYKPNPCLAGDAVRRVAAAAWAANGPAVRDVVNNIGFCLYIRAECLEHIGLLGQHYGRGYYEDVEICLKAREAGWRNVAATGVYVAHASGRSFGDAKQALVARNIAILESRFPNYRVQCATYVQADPLRETRSAIEEHLPPEEPVHLLVSRWSLADPLIARRAELQAAAGAVVILMSWQAGIGGTEIGLRAFSGFGPFSLHFTSDERGLARLQHYLAQSNVRRIEIDGAAEIPAGLFCRLQALDAPTSILVGSLAAASLWRADQAADRRFGAVVALDDMAQAHLTSAEPSRSSASPARQAWAGAGSADRHRPKRCVGVIMPIPSVEADRLLLALSRHLLRHRSLTLTVLGACIDDLQIMATRQVFVTGRIALNDYGDVIGSSAVDALFSPYRVSMYGVLSDLAQATGLPQGYFDWSGGNWVARPGDLSLPYQMPDEAACAAFVNWCLPIHAA